METPRRQRGGLEHEVVAVLAEHGAAMTPGQVRDALAADLAYTTVMTTLAHAQPPVRQHATDIMWVVLGGGIVLGAAALMPVMGFSPIFALCGGFLGWGTILTASRLNARRRRQQFLRGGDLPRAYLPAPK